MGNEHINTIAKGAGIFFVGLASSKLLSYVYRLIMAKGLGPEAYGMFSICFAIISLASTVSIFGLPVAIERYVPYHMTNKAKTRGIIIFALQLSILISIAVTVILYFFAPQLAKLFGSDALLTPLQIFLLSILPLSVLTIYESISRAYKKIEYSIYAHSFLYGIVNLVFAVFAVVMGWGLIGLAAGLLLANLSALLLIFVLIELNHFSIFEKIKAEFMRREILSFSWPLVLSGLFGLLVGWTDTLLLGYFTNEKIVGVYNAAVPTAGLLLVVPVAVISMLVPITSELLSRNRFDKIKESMTLTSDWIFFFNFPIFLVLLAFPKQVLGLVFGAVYTESASVLWILSIGYLMFSLAYPSLKTLELFKKTKTSLLITGLAAILNVILCILFIPKSGMFGAAVSSLFAFMFIYVTSTFISKKILGDFPFSLRAIKSGVVATIVLISLYFVVKSIFSVMTIIPVILLSVAYLAAYLFILTRFILKAEEREIINKILLRFNIKLRI